jgi:RNA polymerase sigma-70 factor, ECF subfamily
MASPLDDERIAELVALIRSRIDELDRHQNWSQDATDDLVQDVLIAVLRRLPQFDPRRASLATFVARITEAVVIDHWRRQAADKRNPVRHRDRPRSGPPDLDQAPGSDRSELRDLMLDLADALRQLPPDLERLARDLQDWSAAEIAERDGAHRGTIYRRIARLKERWADSSLKDYLDL